MKKEVIDIGPFRVEVSLNEDDEEEIPERETTGAEFGAVKKKLGSFTLDELAEAVSKAYGYDVEAIDLIRQIAFYNDMSDKIKSELGE